MFNVDYKEIEALFDRYLADTTTESNIVDLELRRIVAGLGKSTLKLDSNVEKLERTSTFLAWVNIGVGAIVVVIGVIQVVLMFRGH